MKRKISLFLLMLVSIFTLLCANVKVSATGQYFEKVTSAPSDWSGTYLIVSEGSNVAFNGSLTTLDAADNNISVNISNNKIEYSAPLEASTFVIGKSGANYTIKSSSGYYIGNTANSNKLNSDTSNKYTNTISMENNGDVKIVGSGGSVLRYNNDKGNYRFRYFKSGTYTEQEAIQLYKLVESGNSEPEQPEVPVYQNEEVMNIFEKYYNSGSYQKESTLKTGEEADREVTKYFHASANVKERTTVYYKNGLTMYTVQNGSEKYSTYENYVDELGNASVHHHGLGGDYYFTNTADGKSGNTVEDIFVTLHDFINYETTYSTIEKYKEFDIEYQWVYDEDREAYVHQLVGVTEDQSGNLTTEHPLTYMAREFVAPMWLAPNKDNYAYAILSQLVVKEVGDTLVMQLVVDPTSQGYVKNNEGILSEVVITAKPITSIPEAIEAEDGALLEITGTVTGFYATTNDTGEWNDQYGNMSVYVEDEEGNSIVAYRMITKVEIGAVIKVTGTKKNYYGTHEIEAGCTAEIIKNAPHFHVPCSECGKCISEKCDGAVSDKCEGHIVEDQNYPDVTNIINLSFSGIANKASGDSYMKTNYPNWVIGNKLGNGYAAYLGFGRDGSETSSLTSPLFSASKDFTLKAVIKGNGSDGVCSSTLTFTLLDNNGNVVATGYSNAVSAIQAVNGKDTTYNITFTYVDGKTYLDAAQLKISFAKDVGNIGLKTLNVA